MPIVIIDVNLTFFMKRLINLAYLMEIVGDKSTI